MQVNELTMQNEYQLRLKDLAMNEKVKELTEKFTAELDVDKTKFDTLLQEKNEQELDFEEKMKQFEEKHQAQLATLDGQYQAKIMAEVERYTTASAICCLACLSSLLVGSDVPKMLACAIWVSCLVWAYCWDEEPGRVHG